MAASHRVGADDDVSSLEPKEVAVRMLFAPINPSDINQVRCMPPYCRRDQVVALGMEYGVCGEFVLALPQMNAAGSVEGWRGVC